MFHKRKSLVIILVLLALSATLCAHATQNDNPPAPKGTQTLPRLDLPTGWTEEDGLYPPTWAPTLPWKGALKLRFSPGMFKAQDRFLWSYVIETPVTPTV